MNTTLFDPGRLKKLREETPGCQTHNHLNNAGSSLMPTPVIEAIRSHITLEGEIGGYEAHDTTEKQVSEAYAEAARFLNTKPSNIAYVANATDAFARALSSIPFEKRDVILTSEDDYISNQIMYLSLQKRWGIKLVRVPAQPSGGIDLEAADRLIKEVRPRLVAVTHVPTNSGLIQDVHGMGELCEKHGVYYLVDACQSVGQLPINLQELKCDFLSATMRKFLRGPRGAGFLYVSDRILEEGLEPLFIDMRGAEWIETNRYQPFETARRFEDWEFAYALVHGSREAFKYAHQLGIQQISDRVVTLAAGLRARLSELEGVQVLDRGEKLSAIVTCKVPAENDDQLISYLHQHKIHAGISLWHYATIDFQRKGVDWALRLAPHYYNTEEEIDQVVEVLEAMPH